MEQIYTIIESGFNWIIQYGILLIELVGVCVLMYTIFKALKSMIRKTPGFRLDLAEGIALSLEFKMGGELLRTVIVREWKELLILGSVILLRAALTFLIHWEIKIERNQEATEKTVLPADDASDSRK